MDYHLKLRHEFCQKYQFSRLFDLQHLTVCRQIELVLYIEKFSKWEVALVEAGKEYIKLKKYYPFFSDAIHTYVLPKKEKDYAAKVRHYHLFEPRVEKKLSYTMSLTLYGENIFKHLGRAQGNYDEAIAADISKYYRQQNVRGPEAVIVITMNETFAVIVIRGVTSTFWKRYQRDSQEAQGFFAKATKRLAEEAVRFSFLNQQYPLKEILFMDFQWEQDILYMVVLCDTGSWQKILSEPPLAACFM
jgi:hypothetical protein